MVTVLLVVASQGYQPAEYGVTRAVLEQAEINVVVASDKPGIAQSMVPTGPYAQTNVDVVLDRVDIANYDGIFVVGGSGPMRLLNNQTMYALLQKAYTLKKAVGGICIAPRILAHAGILTDKKATGWDDDHGLDAVFKEHSVIRVKQPVVVDGNIITADGPNAAEKFGKAIVQALQ